MKQFNIQHLKFKILFLISFVSSQINAQNLTSSPYSRYGLGEINAPVFVQNMSMGGLAVAMQNDSITSFYINASNPASYVSCGITTFEAGVFSNTVNRKSDGLSQVTNNTSLSYFAFAIPVMKWWGTGFGLMPYSSVGYKISNSQNMDSIGRVTNQYSGSGGLNRFYIGNSFKIKKISIGLNVSYLFGNIEHISGIEYPSNNYFNVEQKRSNNFSGFYLDYGAQYLQKIKNDWSIVFGGTVTLSSDVKAKSTGLSRSLIPWYPYRIDTIQNATVNGNITLPLSIGAGISIRKGQKLLIGIDYAIQNWSTFNFLGDTGKDLQLKDNLKIAIGAQYIPDINNIQGSYWNRVQYRAGIRYSDSNLNLMNTPLNEYAFSMGLGMPVGRNRLLQQYSLINIGAEIGERGTITNGLVKENFFKLMLGLTINDRWFIKSKFD